ncbi:hypothetical protein ABI_35550 [Asticcacaulis biprosthecium C19]|uniref:Uncharacterized protein n=1 Tax=Asticcacaulis biprosthecium C19 TaxID=715226 RepID=F4QQP5_9CAUL|nr:hypothetical protein [Asticcacaulis biprosthecium]EGF90532.1 hypothetical protein ABI_35550 [Asticcacaulis biprosthecium C19]
MMMMAPVTAAAFTIGPQSTSDEIRAVRPLRVPALRLSYTLDQAGEAPQAGTVTLADDFTAVFDEDGIRVEDIAICRSLSWKVQAHAFDNDSCYAMPAFRIVELQNRRYLASLMAEIKPSDGKSPANLAPYWAEQELAVQTDPVDHLVATEAETQIEWRLGKDVVVTTSQRGHAFTEQEKPRVARYFARFVNLHPQVRRAILTSGQWPERIQIESRSTPQATTVVLTFFGYRKGNGRLSGAGRIDTGPAPAGLPICRRNQRKRFSFGSRRWQRTSQTGAE